MRPRKTKKRSAWLITWESSRDDYLKDLQRPRVVAILKPQLSSSTIKNLLPILFTTESQLTFGEKISYSFARHRAGLLREDLQSIYCGDNPWLRARLVTNLYVQTYENTHYRETLHWTEYPRKDINPDTHRLIDVLPARQDSEDAHFDVLFYGKSFLEEKATTSEAESSGKE